MRVLYVVWKMNDGATKSDTVKVEGKVNHLTVEKAVKEQRLRYYDRWDFSHIVSWQFEEEFTLEEEEEFWKK